MMEILLLKNDEQAEGSHRGKLTPLADKVGTKMNSRTSPVLHSTQLPYLPVVITFLTKQANVKICI